jgi:hypothetical protein
MEGLIREFHECVYWAALCFVSGVMLREWAQDTIGKWLGRMNILVAVVLLSMFGHYSVEQCQIQYQVTAAKQAKEISYEDRTNGNVATSFAPGREIRTPAGRLVTVRIDSDSASGSASADRFVPRISSSTRWGADGRGYSDRQFGRSADNGSGEVRDFGRLPISQPRLSDIR